MKIFTCAKILRRVIVTAESADFVITSAWWVVKGYSGNKKYMGEQCFTRNKKKLVLKSLSSKATFRGQNIFNFQYEYLREGKAMLEKA